MVFSPGLRLSGCRTVWDMQDPILQPEPGPECSETRRREMYCMDHSFRSAQQGRQPERQPRHMSRDLNVNCTDQRER